MAILPRTLISIITHKNLLEPFKDSGVILSVRLEHAVGLFFREVIPLNEILPELEAYFQGKGESPCMAVQRDLFRCMDETEQIFFSRREDGLLVGRRQNRLSEIKSPMNSTISARQYKTNNFNLQETSLCSDDTHVLFSDWIPSTAINHLVVIRLDHIGDTYLSLPALRKLKRRFPMARITVVCGPWSKSIFQREGVDSIICIPFFGENGALGGTNGLSDQDRNLLARLVCDLAIDLRIGEDTRDALKLVPARITAAYPAENFSATLTFPYAGGSRDCHHSLQIDFLVDRLPVFASEQLPIAKRRRQSSERLTIGLSPASSSDSKRWPLNRWIEFGKNLKSLGFYLLLMGGPREQEICGKISEVTGIPVHPIVPVADFPECVLESCDLYVGHDTGPTHGVAMTGLPVLEIMGGLNSQREWMAYGPNVLVLTKKPPCSPCYFYDTTLCPYRLKCLDIPVEDALWGVGQLLSLPM